MKVIRVVCPGAKIPVRAQPNIKADTLRFISSGEEIHVVSNTKNGFYVLANEQGYVNKATKRTEWIDVTPSDEPEPIAPPELLVEMLPPAPELLPEPEQGTFTPPVPAEVFVQPAPPQELELEQELQPELEPDREPEPETEPERVPEPEQELEPEREPEPEQAPVEPCYDFVPDSVGEPDIDPAYSGDTSYAAAGAIDETVSYNSTQPETEPETGIESSNFAPPSPAKYFGAPAPKCAVCVKSVYAAEKILAINSTWHKLCFTCGGRTSDGCKKKLSLDNYVDHAGDPFCRICHTKLFGPKGFHGGMSAAGISTAGPSTASVSSPKPPLTAAPSTAIEKKIPVIGIGAPKCAVCEKSVYAAEKILAINSTWHKLCFTCGGRTSDGCKKRLALDNYVDHSGDPFCRMCHTKLFGPKGFHAGMSAAGMTTVSHSADSRGSDVQLSASRSLSGDAN